MKNSKRAFTLIEIIIATLLISLLVVFLYQSLSVLKTSNASLISKDEKAKERDFIFSLLHKDIFESTSAKTITTSSKDFDLFYLQTRNSLHDLINPNILYVVAKEDKKLLRIESNKEIKLPIAEENIYSLYVDEIAKNIEYLKIFSVSKDANDTNASAVPNLSHEVGKTSNCGVDMLMAIKLKNEKPIVFEIER